MRLLYDRRNNLPHTTDNVESVMYSDCYAVENGDQTVLYEDVEGPQKIIAIYEKEGTIE